MNIDIVDRKIIAELQSNGRESRVWASKIPSTGPYLVALPGGAAVAGGGRN